jgi:hypothetical protein
MKRIVIAILLLLAFLVALFVRRLMVDPKAPTFHPAVSQPLISPYIGLSYEFLTQRPFEGGKMWITVFSLPHENHRYLFDIARRQIVGELFNADPIFMNGDQSRLLCRRRASGKHPLREKVANFIERITRGKIRFPPYWSEDAETFWLVDLKRDSPDRVGGVSQVPGGGTSFVPSPDFRYGYGFLKPSGILQKPGFFLCDLEKNVFTRIGVDDWPVGWWDETSIVIKDPNDNFVRYHVVTGKVSLLLSAAQVAAYFEQANIKEDPSKFNLIFVWNGHENDVYLTDIHKKYQGLESCLVKVERPAATPKLVSRNFKFEWSDHLHPTGNYYLFSGRESGHGSSGVFLRDLASNTNRQLIPPDGDSKYFSIPRFYGNSVIYIRSNMLWQVDLNGSNSARLFPSP